jgi:hypothetical protein
MNKRILLGLSAILFVLIGTLAHQCFTSQTTDKGGATVLRADGDPMPRPWPIPPSRG